MNGQILNKSEYCEYLSMINSPREYHDNNHFIEFKLKLEKIKMITRVVLSPLVCLRCDIIRCWNLSIIVMMLSLIFALGYCPKT